MLISRILIFVAMVVAMTCGLICFNIGCINEGILNMAIWILDALCYALVTRLHILTEENKILFKYLIGDEK